ncbi:MAG: XTP/dITP diphosphatase [Bacillota bacterium]|nr:XTP/dITP diphosphatase [Bacillota bacterium]
MKKIIFATGNAGKMKEIRMILADLRINGEEAEILSMKEAGIDTEIIEDGRTFAENAIIKAKAVAACAEGAIVLADDSGLEIDYLNKEPGIYSARYLGEDTSYHKKNANLIDRLTGVPDKDRTARFVCAIACVLPDGEVMTEEATIEGRIGYEEKGRNGFGYDPIFIVPEYDKSTAQLTEEEKNEISHRGKALRGMKRQLKAYFDEQGMN